MMNSVHEKVNHPQRFHVGKPLLSMEDKPVEQILEKSQSKDTCQRCQCCSFEANVTPLIYTPPHIGYH